VFSEKDEEMNIVAIRPDAIGDSLVSFPILVALRTKYTNPHITFIGNPGAMPLAKDWGIADTVYNYDTQWAEIYSPEGIRHSKVRTLFSEADLVVSWTEDSEVTRRNLLELGVQEIVTIPIFFKELVRIANEPMHVVEYFARWIDIPIPRPERITLPNIGSQPFCLYKPPIAIHPGSGSAYRRWPVASFAELIVLLVRRQYPIILLAGPDEGSLVTDILLLVRQQVPKILQSGLITILKKAPLLEVSQRLKQCGCFVGHDTGTTHLAALLRIPTLAIFGDTNLTLWRPLGPTVEAIQEKQLEQLTTERVFESVLRLYQSQERLVHNFIQEV